MIKTNHFLFLLSCNLVFGANFDEPKEIQVNYSAYEQDQLSLKGIGARRQLVVTGKYHDGDERDLTRLVRMEAQPVGVVEISKDGWIKPLSDGEAIITIHAAGNLKSSVKVSTSESGKIQRVNFPNEITPLFTKYGCNGGGCHGKSGGQNGFRLSLLGFEPDEDYEYIVKEGRGRRIFPAAPERSLLLTKATNETPHGGGSKITKGSLDYELIRSWISQGMPYGEKDDPVLEEVSVFPAQRVMDMRGEQQLVVTAKYSDGSLRDVTRSSIFEVNDEEGALKQRSKIQRIMDSVWNLEGATNLRWLFITDSDVDLFEEGWMRVLLWQFFCRFDVGRDLHFDIDKKRVCWDATAPIPSLEGPVPVRRWPGVTLHDEDVLNRVDSWLEEGGF